MKHPDDDHEGFNRLEAEMAADSGGEVVDPAPTSGRPSRPSRAAIGRSTVRPQPPGYGPAEVGTAARGDPGVSQVQARVPHRARPTRRVRPHTTAYDPVLLPWYPAPLVRQAPRAWRSSSLAPCAGSPTPRASRCGRSPRAARTSRNLKLSRQRDHRAPTYWEFSREYMGVRRRTAAAKTCEGLADSLATAALGMPGEGPGTPDPEHVQRASGTAAPHGRLLCRLGDVFHVHGLWATQMCEALVNRTTQPAPDGLDDSRERF